MTKTNAKISPDDVVTMIAMAAEGKSAGEIAKAIGKGVTRNTVIGRLSRKGVYCHSVRRGNPKPRLPKVPKSIMPEFKAAPLPPPVTPPIEPMLRDGEPITLLTARFNECKWIQGDPTESQQVCGRHSIPGKSYCPEHYAICCQPGSARRGAQSDAAMTDPT